MDKQIKQALDHQLGEEPLFHEWQKREIRKRVTSNSTHKPHRSRLFIAVPVAVFFLLLAGGYLFSQLATPTSSTQTAQQTPIEPAPEIPIVTPDEDDLLIEWAQDNMDRGNHDYITINKAPLVVDPNTKEWSQGDVVYYTQPQVGEEPPSMSIGRIIGLPGSTVEIIDGQVYLDGEPVNTFYGQARTLGLTEEEYFQKVNAENVDIQSMKEYFATSMEKVTVPQNSYFILSDMWWRGTDSKEFGPVEAEALLGKVEGYAEEGSFTKASKQTLAEVFPQINFEEVSLVNITRLGNGLGQVQFDPEKSAHELSANEIGELMPVLTSQQVTESQLQDDTGLRFTFQIVIFTKEQELFLVLNEDLLHPNMTTLFYNSESTELYTYIDEFMKSKGK